MLTFTRVILVVEGPSFGHSRLAPGAMAGIIVGSIVEFICVVTVCFILYRHKQHASNTRNNVNNGQMMEIYSGRIEREQNHDEDQ